MSYSGISNLRPNAPSPTASESAQSLDALIKQIEGRAGYNRRPKNEDFLLAAKHGSEKGLLLLFNNFDPLSLGATRAGAVKAFANATDSRGMSALAHAASLGPAGTVALRILLSAGANPSIAVPIERKASAWPLFAGLSDKGKSPLCFAVESNATESISALLAADKSLLERDHCDERGRHPLAIAAANGFYYAAELLLAAGPASLPWSRGEDGICPVEHAISSGSLNILASLIARNPGAKSYWLRANENGDAILGHAVRHGSSECLAKLIELASDRPELAPAFVGGRKQAPLLIAAQLGDQKKYQMLLAPSSAILSLREMEEAALPALPPTAPLPESIAALGAQALWMKASQEFSMAARKKNTPAWIFFEGLSKMIMDKDVHPEEFTTALNAACLKLFDQADSVISRLDGGHFDRASIFQPDEFSMTRRRPSSPALTRPTTQTKSSGSSIFQKENLFTLLDGDGRSLFYLASQKSRPKMLSALLRMAHELSMAAPETDLALKAAARAGHEECLGFLFDQGVSVGLPFGQTAAKTSSLRAPLPRALSIDLPGPDGKTALAAAAESGSSQCCQILLDLGASPSSRDAFGWTPYMRAAEGGHLRAMDLLFEADPSCQDQRSHAGETPAMIACGANQPSALAILCSTPESMARRARETRDDGSTALMMAAGGNCLACAEFILAASDVDAQNQRGATALSAAAHAMSIDVIKLLAPISNPALADADGMTPLIYAIIQQPESPLRADAISILADAQDPREIFTPSKLFQARFGDQVARGFDAMQWAEFISSRGAFDADREIIDMLTQKADVWRAGELPLSPPPLEPAQAPTLGEATLSATSPLESSDSELPDRLMDAAKLARRRLDRAMAIVDAPLGIKAP